MNSDDLFRVALLGVVAVSLPFAVYHRVRSISGEKLDNLFGLL